MSSAAATSGAMSQASRSALVAQCYQQLHRFISQVVPASALSTTAASAAHPRGRGRGNNAAAPTGESDLPTSMSIPYQRFVKALQFNNVLNAVDSSDLEEQRAAIRAALIAMPVEVCRQLPPTALNDVDSLLQAELQAQPITDAVMDLAPADPNHAGLVVWQGDMSLLRCDAVVNPGNNALLGCFLPAHRCLDNILHAQSGPRLRLACADELDRLGISEDTNGNCRVTAGFALPARYVFHTVGPCLVPLNHRGPARKPNRVDASELRQCYVSCLDTAAQMGLNSIAFCCISTGIFGYPSDQAADIAIRTCLDWQMARQAQQASELRIVFNVFKDEDLAIYNTLLPVLAQRTAPPAPPAVTATAAAAAAATTAGVAAVAGSADGASEATKESAVVVDDDEPE
jgi:O-acetyl-ADP-ribose deacetylase (regulator of RNase III)